MPYQTLLFPPQPFGLSVNELTNCQELVCRQLAAWSDLDLAEATQDPGFWVVLADSGRLPIEAVAAALTDDTATAVMRSVLLASTQSPRRRKAP